MENEKIEITGEEKEPVQKLTNTELNNNIILDIIIKSSKIQQMVNVLMDYNNIEKLDVSISSEDYKFLQDNFSNIFATLKNNVDLFVDDYENKRKDK